MRLLEEHFGDLVEYDFTAEMEDDLDRIADGEADRVDWLNGFYFGSDQHRGLRQVVDNLGDIDAREINSVAIADDITLRIGKYGPYLETVDPDAAPDRRRRPPRRVNLPEDLAPDELTEAKARELIDAPVQSDRVLGVNPDNGKQIVVKDGRFGPYVTELEPEPEADAATSRGRTRRRPGDRRGRRGEPKTKRGAKKPAAVKPRTASLFKSMDIEDDRPRDRAEAARPAARRSASTPSRASEITAQNGRYGPYLKKGADTRSLPSEDAIFDIDLAGCARALRAAEVRRAPCVERAQGVRRRPRERQADQGEGRPLRAVRHRRHDERDDPARRVGRGDHLRARRRAAADQARQGSGGAARQEARRPRSAATRKTATKK